jgi:Tol biopolymer transport system component
MCHRQLVQIGGHHAHTIDHPSRRPRCRPRPRPDRRAPGHRGAGARAAPAALRDRHHPLRRLDRGSAGRPVRRGAADQRQRPVRHVQLGRHEPRAGRHQRHLRRVRPRPLGRRHDQDLSIRRRRPGQRPERRRGDQRRRPVRHVPIGGDEPGARRHEQPHDVFVHDRQTGATTRIAPTTSGQQPNGYSFLPDISGDGRYVLFGSFATNLIPGGDVNADDADQFVYDRQTGRSTLVNVSTGGVQSNDYALGEAISFDGRYVLFSSQASNLVPGDTNDAFDVFVRDRLAGTTTRVSVPNAGLGTQGDQGSFGRTISPDGRYIAFDSQASNLVAGDTNDTGDAFVLDRSTGTTTLVSLSDAGRQSPAYSSGTAVSADGRYAAFVSNDGNLVPGDTNQHPDIFIRNLRTARTIRINLSNAGAQGDGESVSPAMTDDGLNVVYASEATNLVPGDTNGALDVFLNRRARD